MLEFLIRILGITDFLSKIKKKFEEIRNLVTEKMDNIKSSAVSKVNEMKKGLSDGVERIKESFRSGFSTLVGYVKSPINSIIRFINNFLYAIQTMQNSFANALNSMSISLPHWLEKLTGFSSVGFNVGYWSAPMVPYLARITSHVFRHTFATRAIEAGMPPQVLKTILGHSSLAMTMDLYSHVLPDTKADEMQKIANVF